MTTYEYLAFVCAAYDVTDPPSLEHVTNGALLGQTLANTPKYYNNAKNWFLSYGVTDPASIERVITIATTHTRLQLIAGDFD